MNLDHIKYDRVKKKWMDQLVSLLDMLKIRGEDKFFHPHPFTRESVDHIALYNGFDRYYVQVFEERVVGYGMLRGWDEGYNIPSLGIVIHPEMRNCGLAKDFVSFLHDKAKKMGAAKVRLKVYEDNITAIGLYKKLGYHFKTKADGQLVGFIKL